MAKGYIVSIHKKIIDEEKLKLYGVHAKSALEANTCLLYTSPSPRDRG